MKILLVRPKPHKETIGLQSVMICEPLELMTLRAVLENNGHQVTILDMIIERKPLRFFIEKHQPDFVGITGYISHVGIMRRYAAEIKAVSGEIKVAVGGVHAEMCPEDFASPFIDLIATGAEDFYYATGCTDLTPQLPNRNLPARYRQRYYYMFHADCALIKTSVGCPYSCNFCFCKEIAAYKARPLAEVMEELFTIPQKEVYIVDDDFLFNRERLLEFADRVEALDFKQNYLVYGRADFIAHNEDIIQRLAQVGLRAVIVGLEAATQDQLNAYNKKTKLEDNEHAVRILKKHGVECYATVMLGIDWTRREFNNLYDFLNRLDITFVNLQPLTPMPRTPYFAEYADRLIIPYEEHEKWDMAHLVVQPTQISIRRFYWETLKLYFKITANPRKGRYMAKKYGLKNTRKLSFGAGSIVWQYLAKILRG